MDMGNESNDYYNVQSKTEKCFACYKTIEEHADNGKTLFSQAGEEEIIRNQLTVVFLVRKLFNIPEEACSNLLQEHGNPSSWIYWCNSCFQMVEKAKGLFDGIMALEKQIEDLRNQLENSIASSEHHSKTKTLEVGNTVHGPTEIIRSLIMGSVSNNSFNLTKVKREINSIDEENAINSLEYSSYVKEEAAEDSGSEWSGADDESMISASENDYNEQDYHELQNNEHCNLKREIFSENSAKTVVKHRKLTYKCPVCPEYFHTAKKMREHHLTHPPLCPYCSIQCVSKTDFKSHIKTHQDEAIKLKECSICGEDFEKCLDISKHRCRRVKPNYFCSKCSQAFYNETNFKIHERKHDEGPALKEAMFVAILPYICSTCKHECPTEEEMKDHQKLHPPNGICPHCNKDCKSPFKLNLHLITHKDRSIKPFECTICGKGFRSAKNLNWHKKVHREDCPYRCNICGRNLSCPTALANHLEVHKNGPARPPQNSVCPICNKDFQTAAKLKLHEIAHEDRSIRPFSCDMCEKTFRSKKNLNVHKKTHKEDCSTRCNICGKNLISAKSLEHHLEVHKKGPFRKNENRICPHCDRDCKTPAKLKLHIISHSDPSFKPFPCDMCEKAFRSKKNLNVHKKTHKEDCPNRCNICGKNLISPKSLAHHLEVHKGELPKVFLCTTCGKSFSMYSSLKNHEFLHTGLKPHACSYCDRKFSKRSSRLSHERTHTGEKPFKCKFCEEHFGRYDSLKVHIRTHTGEPAPYPCSFCEKRFDTSRAAKIHEMSHTGEKPFSCSLCNKNFNRLQVLLKHKRTVHSLQEEKQT